MWTISKGIFLLLTALLVGAVAFGRDKVSNEIVPVPIFIKTDTISKVFGFDGQKRYAYCPSVVQEGEKRHIWFCGTEPEGQFIDHIYYIRGDAVNPAATIKMVLAPGVPGTWDSRHVCDPSVIEGEFKFNGQKYKYAMFYLGNRSDRYFNEIGVAFANSLDAGVWIKYPRQLVEKTWNGDNDIPIAKNRGVARMAWGIGQPSAISLDKKGSVLLTYTIGDYSGSRVVARKVNLLNMTSPVWGDAVTVSVSGLKQVNKTTPDITVNADFALDEDSRNIYMIRHVLPNPTGYPSFISEAVELDSMPYKDFLVGNGTWQSVVRIDPTKSGFPRNHNACIGRNAFGSLNNPATPELYFTVSKEFPQVSPTTNTHAEWTYQIYKYIKRAQ